MVAPQLSQTIYFRLVTIGLVTIFLYKLFPYDISFINGISLAIIQQGFSQDKLTQPKDFFELTISLLTFAVFGFGLAGGLRRPAAAGLAAIFLACVGFSSLSESLQAFSLTRNPNLLDVATDSLGGLGGAWLYATRRDRALSLAAAIGQASRTYLRSQLSVPALAAGFIGYFLLASVSMSRLPFAIDFSNWDTSFPLIVGNELTGDRPWQGTVGTLQFFGQAMPKADVAALLANRQGPLAPLASYRFDQNGPDYADQTGQLPNLGPIGEFLASPNSTGIALDAEHWLQTSVAATYLNQQIKQQAQLTLNLTVQSADLTQQGPARIVSLSTDPFQRNLTLGQAEANLVLRLRTPFTGRNANRPQLVIPQIFTDTRMHHIVITYANAVLQVYVDSVDNLYRLKIPYLGYKVCCYAAVFVPLAGLLSLILMHTYYSLSARLMLFVGGIALPALLLEGWLAAAGHRRIAAENLLLSLGLMAIALWLGRRQLKPWLSQP